MSWWSDLFRKPAFLVTEYHPEDQPGWIPVKSDGISQPVKEIVATFYEKGRWKLQKHNYDWNKRYYMGRGETFKVVDRVTKEEYSFRSDSYKLVNKLYGDWNSYFVPRTVNEWGLPSWMTEKEKEYVVLHANKLLQKLHERITIWEDRKRSKWEAQAKINQDKERQRLVELYCK